MPTWILEARARAAGLQVLETRSREKDPDGCDQGREALVLLSEEDREKVETLSFPANWVVHPDTRGSR